MGKFKVGDKVRFLSSSGCGIIRSFAATNVVNVEDESGFEIPTMLSDLIPSRGNDFRNRKTRHSTLSQRRENKQSVKPRAGNTCGNRAA